MGTRELWRSECERVISRLYSGSADRARVLLQSMVSTVSSKHVLADELLERGFIEHVGDSGYCRITLTGIDELALLIGSYNVLMLYSA
jgi:hypothetical protein